jgi:dolichyl-phosphate-mannose--protein O-mannosyl transferase
MPQLPAPFFLVFVRWVASYTPLNAMQVQCFVTMSMPSIACLPSSVI